MSNRRGLSKSIALDQLTSRDPLEPVLNLYRQWSRTADTDVDRGQIILAYFRVIDNRDIHRRRTWKYSRLQLINRPQYLIDLEPG
ncbi:hypothetical protein D3C81_907920 [compost metagenome]